MVGSNSVIGIGNTFGNQGYEWVGFFFYRPSHRSEYDNSEFRIIVRESVMSGGSAKDAGFLYFQGPENWRGIFAYWGNGASNYYRLRSDRYKLVVYGDGSRDSYDLETDPRELRSFAGIGNTLRSWQAWKNSFWS